MEMTNCSKCICWKKLTADTGECRYSPPSPNGNNIASYPRTHGDYFCFCGQNTTLLVEKEILNG